MVWLLQPCHQWGACWPCIDAVAAEEHHARLHVKAGQRGLRLKARHHRGVIEALLMRGPPMLPDCSSTWGA